MDTDEDIAYLLGKKKTWLDLEKDLPLFSVFPRDL